MNLVFQDIVIHNRRRTVFDGLSIVIKPKTVTAVIGPSKSGKSTLLLAAGQYIPLTRGSIRLENSPHPEETTPPAPLHRQPTWQDVSVGPIPGFSPLFDTLTVREHLVFHGRLLRQKMHAKRVDELLDTYHLADVARMRIKDLDAFSYFRTTLAVTTLHNPAFVLLDEPMDGLSDEEWQHGQTYFKPWMERGCALLYTTVLVSATEAADTVLYLPSGEVVSK